MNACSGRTGPPRNGWRRWKKSGANTTDGDIMLGKDFKEFIVSLNRNDVRYLVVGGYAVALHGYPRYTKDLDVWIWLSPLNARRILKALEDFGFGSLNLDAEDFLEEGQIVQLGYAPNRIDIMTSLDGVEFEECYQSREVIDIDGIQVNFISRRHLTDNKRATGRTQDIADAEHLELPPDEPLSSSNSPSSP